MTLIEKSTRFSSVNKKTFLFPKRISLFISCKGYEPAEVKNIWV